MKVLIIGKNGQLARELISEKPDFVHCLCLGRNETNIFSHKDFSQVVTQYQPQVIINASGYTDVEKAELEPNAAFALNQVAVELMTKVSKDHGARFLHVSTDYVFDGESCSPYTIYDAPNPINVYGKSKLAGERVVGNIYPENSAVIRTSALYSIYQRNFVSKMLELMSEKKELNVVCDQFCSPTYAKGLAQFLWRIVGISKLEPVYHWCDSGMVSWHEFALSIQDSAITMGLLGSRAIIVPVSSSVYNSRVNRPMFSALDSNRSFEIKKAKHWATNLKECLKELKRMSQR